jgi:hypothetical protein
VPPRPAAWRISRGRSPSFSPRWASRPQAILGEAYIGRAFGNGDGKVENPTDLEEARKAYDAGLAIATGAASADLLLGRLHEGLAAVAKYQGKSADVCPHAKAAAEHYAKGGATPYLQEGPKALADEARCP